MLNPHPQEPGFYICEGHLCLICTLYIPMDMLPVNSPIPQSNPVTCLGMYAHSRPVCHLLLGFQHKRQAESMSVFSYEPNDQGVLHIAILGPTEMLAELRRL